MTRKVLVSLAVLGMVVVFASSGLAAAKGPGTVSVRVTPATGFQGTKFVVSFRNPERTGRYGASDRHDLLSASGPAGAGCVQNVTLRAADAAKGARVRIELDPSHHGGSWCAGKYSGEIEEFAAAHCAKNQACPAFVLLRGIIGHFTFRVEHSNDTTAPAFGGITGSFACTPGPQRPGQTTPFTLSWHAATDNVTSSSQIVYDVYVATTKGAEDLSRPTWTTPPGVTSYRTPGLASHGTFFFVVRARDQAGNHDANRVERQGIDPCL